MQDVTRQKRPRHTVFLLPVAFALLVHCRTALQKVCAASVCPSHVFHSQSQLKATLATKHLVADKAQFPGKDPNPRTSPGLLQSLPSQMSCVLTVLTSNHGPSVLLYFRFVHRFTAQGIPQACTLRQRLGSLQRRSRKERDVKTILEACGSECARCFIA